jgi:hypothetical protein
MKRLLENSEVFKNNEYIDLFLDNKYTRTYCKLMEKRIQIPMCGTFEKHHMIPKCLGGNNKKINIVRLSLREHFIAHRLLAKMCKLSTNRSKMNFAIHCLCIRYNKKQCSSRIFEIGRKSLSLANKERPCLESTKEKIRITAVARGQAGVAAASAAAKIANRGRTHTLQSCKNMSDARVGTVFTEEHRKNIGISSKGRTWSDAQKRAFSKSQKEDPARGYNWTLIDPNNKMHHTKNVFDFCTQNGLAYSVLRYRAQQNDCSPVTRGPSKGWIVFGVSKKVKKQKKTSWDQRMKRKLHKSSL